MNDDYALNDSELDSVSGGEPASRYGSAVIGISPGMCEPTHTLGTLIMDAINRVNAIAHAK